MRRAARAWARPLVGAVILAVLVWRLGTGPFVAGVRRLDGWSLLTAVGIAALTTVCAAWRWQAVLRGLGVRLPLRRAIAAYYQSQFINSALPGGVVGDVRRGVRNGLDGGNVGRGLRAVFWERVAGLVVLLALVLGVLAVADSPVRTSVGWVAAGLATAVLGVVVVLRALPSGGASWWARAVRSVRADVRDGLLAPRAWPVVAVSSCAIAVGHAATFVVAAVTTGADASPARLWPLAFLVLLAMALPFSVGGWGPREGVAAWVFAAAGLGAAQGVAAATAYGVMAFVATLPGAVLLLADALRGRRIRGPAVRSVLRPEAAEAAS